MLAADSSAALKMPAGTPIADQVQAQLRRDYPPGALSWVTALTWTGPARVPLAQIDRTAGKAEWDAAAADKAKQQLFRKKIAAGFRKPVVLVRPAGGGRLYAVDGHSRITASDALGLPVSAYIGTAKTAHGPWEQAHSRQLASDLAAIELSASGYPAGTIKPRSGMISLDLPQGTIKPVPGGTTDHHITVCYLGEDVDDAAFAKACARAKSAAAAVSGPLAGKVGGVGSFPPSDGADTRPAFAKVSLPGATSLRSALKDLSASEFSSWKPHVTIGYVGKDDPLPSPVPPTAVKFTHLSVHRGKNVARFPLGAATEHANDGRAIELGVSHGGRPMDTSPFSASTTSNWVARAGGLPDYVRGVAHALLRKGRARDESHAISMAVGLMRDWASGRTSTGKGHVHPAVQAAAAKALAQWQAMRAHAHASDAPVVDLAGAFSEQLHPRVAKGHAGGGRFGSGNTPLTAGPGGKAVRLPPPRPVQPEPPAEVARIRQLRFQASADRHLARQILVKAQGLVRIRDGYTAGLLTPTGKAKTSVVSAKRSAAAKKAAKTRKSTPRKKAAKSSTPRTAAAVKAGNVAKLNGQISTLRNDARALITSADKLDRMANGL